METDSQFTSRLGRPQVAEFVLFERTNGYHYVDHLLPDVCHSNRASLHAPQTSIFIATRNVGLQFSYGRFLVLFSSTSKSDRINRNQMTFSHSRTFFASSRTFKFFRLIEWKWDCVFCRISDYTEFTNVDFYQIGHLCLISKLLEFLDTVIFDKYLAFKKSHFHQIAISKSMFADIFRPTKTRSTDHFFAPVSSFQCPNHYLVDGSLCIPRIQLFVCLS